MTTNEITETNAIICGDCRDQLTRIPDGSVDLIYLDPPFFSGKNYEIIWKDGAEIRSFTDTEFYTLVCKCGEIFPDKNKFCAECGAGRDEATEHKSKDIQAYLQWLRPKLERCRDVLKETGSIYVHLDYHAIHYVKILMDDIFGVKNFINEIIWSYQGTGEPKRSFKRKHDNILLYSKGKGYIFNQNETTELISDSSKTKFTKEDDKGRFKVIRHPDGSEHKQYMRNAMRMRDVWELPIINAMAKERLGYPTQKPETLLERIIKASSNPGDVVLDPFCGCGTAIAVAQKLGRKWIGIDVSPTSTKLMVKRLQTTGAKITEADIINLPRTLKELRVMDPFEFQNLVIEKLHGKQNPKKVGDGGIDGWVYHRSGYEGMNYKTGGLDASVQVKRSDDISTPEIKKFAGAMMDDDETDGKHGIFVAFSFVKTAPALVKRLMTKKGVNIELVTTKELFDCED